MIFLRKIESLSSLIRGNKLPSEMRRQSEEKDQESILTSSPIRKINFKISKKKKKEDSRSVTQREKNDKEEEKKNKYRMKTVPLKLRRNRVIDPVSMA